MRDKQVTSRVLKKIDPKIRESINKGQLKKKDADVVAKVASKIVFHEMIKIFVFGFVAMIGFRILGDFLPISSTFLSWVDPVILGLVIFGIGQNHQKSTDVLEGYIKDPKEWVKKYFGDKVKLVA
ncbi:hypothetical protein ACFLZ7_02210 [Nanoarchaeota archaeon]